MSSEICKTPAPHCPKMHKINRGSVSPCFLYSPGNVHSRSLSLAMLIQGSSRIPSAPWSVHAASCVPPQGSSPTLWHGALAPVGHRLWGQSWLPPLSPQCRVLQRNNQHLYLQCCFPPPLGEFPSWMIGPTAQTALLKFTICWFSTLKHLLRIWVCSEMYVKHSHRIYGSCWRPSCKKNIAVSLFNAVPCLHLPAVSYFISGFPP